MTELKATPGPWRIEEGVYYACIRTDAGVIADMRFVGGAVRNMADARLIAAAPELLDALQKMVKMASTGMVDFNPHDEFVMSSARAAIAKALGETT